MTSPSGPVERIVRCRDCKHWGHQDSKDWVHNGRKPCASTSQLFDIDGGDCNDSLYTSPDFGCVAGEASNAVLSGPGETAKQNSESPSPGSV